MHIRAFALLAFLFLVFNGSSPLCAARENLPTGEYVRAAVGPALYDVVREATDKLREEKEIGFKLTQTPAGVGILGVADGHFDMAFVTRPPTAEERATHPEADLRSIHFGEQAVAIGVSRDVWEGGVHEITAEQMRGIYEGRIQNWKELGGVDSKIVFFSSTEGRGVWELLAEWLYQSTQKAPLGRFPLLKSHEEARDAIEFTAGAISLLSPAYVKTPSSYVLGIRKDKELLLPTPEAVTSGRYPMRRPIYLVVNDKPSGNARALFSYFETEAGRELLEKYGCVPVKNETE